MDEELKTNINYILTTYPEYIDTLQIVELKNQLLNDYHIDPWNISRAIGGILQLIVNECGSDIVNDINIDEKRINLLYTLVDPCTVKLSTNLRKISPKSFKHLTSTTIEYDGTIKEFNKLIDAN